MNGSEASEIVAKAQVEKHEAKCDDWFDKIKASVTRLAEEQMGSRERTHLVIIAASLRDLAFACEQLEAFEQRDPPELSEEEIEDALEMHESMKQQAADHTQEMAVAQ